MIFEFSYGNVLQIIFVSFSFQFLLFLSSKGEGVKLCPLRNQGNELFFIFIALISPGSLDAWPHS